MMKDAMDVIKRLVAGEEVQYNDKALKFPWVDKGWNLPHVGCGDGAQGPR